MKEGERRISVRTNLGVFAKISKDSLHWEDIDVKDISYYGLGFVAKSKYEKGEMLALEGEVFGLDKSTDIFCDIKIVMVREGLEEKNFYGVKFYNMAKFQQTTLGTFIDSMIAKFPKLELEW